MNDFFIASSADLKCLDIRPPACEALPAPVDSEIDLLMLCNLESILTGTAWENVFDSVYVNPVQDNGPEGPWVYRVSNGLLDALKTLNPDSVVDCAQQWAETDEWTLREISEPEQIVGALRNLIGLAQQAGGQGKDLFIWTEP